MRFSYLFILILLIPLTACSSPVVEAVVTVEATTESEDDGGDNESVSDLPIEVTYFTPSQGEGPYYTVEKPADRDNDLTVLEGAAGAPVGTVLEFGGKVYDANGWPVVGARIEIWQTDDSGVYLHPRDPGTEDRDRNFQFYGEVVTAEDGSYWFRTILPGHYEPRPVHIHFKVFVDGQQVLTSQFYFAGDPGLETDSLVAAAGDESEHLIIQVQDGLGADGNPVLLGERDIILDLK